MNDPLIPLLQTASYEALVLLVARALRRSGFHSVQFMGRVASPDKSTPGGFELLCFAQCAGYRFKAVVKVIRHPFKRRMFHELAGVALCERADFAILVAPHRLSPKMSPVQKAYTCVRVEAIDGVTLSLLLRAQGVGIRASGEPDFAFFTHVDDVAKRYLAFLDGSRL